MRWTLQELSALAGLRSSGVELVLGASDEGDPWCVIYHTSSNRVLAHFARIDGLYVGCWADLVHFRSDCLRSVVDQFYCQARGDPRLSSPIVKLRRLSLGHFSVVWGRHG